MWRSNRRQLLIVVSLFAAMIVWNAINLSVLVDLREERSRIEESQESISDAIYASSESGQAVEF